MSLRRVVVRCVVLAALFAVGGSLPFLVFGGGNAVGALTGTGVVCLPNCGTLSVRIIPVDGVANPTTPSAIPLDGSGTISSNPPGLDCLVTGGVEQSTCSARYTWTTAAGTTTTVTVVATPSAGSYACTNPCALSDLSTSPVAEPGNTVIAGYETANLYEFGFKAIPETLVVTIKGDGTGNVSISSPSSSCTSSCSIKLEYGNVVMLTATPDAGAVFSAWTGGCAGQGHACTITVTSDVTANAVFGVASSTGSTTTTTTSTAKATTITTNTTTTVVTNQGGTSSNDSTTTAPRRLGSLDTQLVAVVSARSKVGGRLEKVELEDGAKVSVELTLRRAHKPLASHLFPSVPRGDAVIALVVPAGVPKGPASLQIVVSDKEGHHTFTRAVRVASSSA
jgi:hypothetical protein